MTTRGRLLGGYLPGGSWLHRIGVAWKYLLFLLLTLPALALGRPAISMCCLLASIILLGSSGLPMRRTLPLSWGVVLLLVLLAGHHLLTGRPGLAVAVPSGILTALYLSRMLTMTTSAPDIVEALARLVRPLSRVGLSGERFGLAVGLMLRSVDYLGDAVADLRQAGAARGLRRLPTSAAASVVIGAVGYAQRTGEALAARGIGEE